MQLDHEYLKQLPNPQNAIVPSVWNTWTQALRLKFTSNESQDFVNLFGMKMADIARSLGLIWTTKYSPTLREIVGMTYDEVLAKPHISSEKKRSIVLTMSRLNELDEVTLQRVAYIPPPVSEQDILEKQKKPLYGKARTTFNNVLTESRKNIKDENFEEIWKDFIKVVLSEVFSLTEFRTENLQRFVKVLFARYEHGKGMTELARDFKMQPGVVNHYLRSFEESFKNNFIKDAHETKLLMVKLAKFYWIAFDVLDKSDLKKRNARLKPVQKFCETLLGENLNKIEV